MRVFINYARADALIADQVAAYLEEQGVDILPDDLTVGDDWVATIQENIHGSEAMLYLVSPDTLASDWCDWEFALARQAGKAIIPIAIREGAAVPDAMADLRVIDMTNGLTESTEVAISDALQHLEAYTIISAQAVEIPSTPSGVPAAAMGTLDISRADRPEGQVLLPNIGKVLPQPFGWIAIGEGQVELLDASEHGGSRGGDMGVGAFHIAQYTVTNAQFQVFVEDAKGYASARWWDFSLEADQWREQNTEPAAAYGNPDSPRTRINWYEAIAFCRWLNVRTRPLSSMMMRIGFSQNAPSKRLPTVALPTEAQWQLASSAGDAGLDVSGSILEWCMSNWTDNVVALDGNQARVVRIGSLDDQFIDRVTHRDYAAPDTRDDRIGVRLVCIV
jgi:formylglycine-generating enzyme required for sulfatase activity